MNYRPWGKIDWALNLSTNQNWSLAGTIGSEERSLATYSHLRAKGLLKRELLFSVQDVYSDKYEKLNKDLLNARIEEFKKYGGDVNSLQHFDLMSELFKLDRLSNEINSLGESVILDLSSMPKRFFFPILRKLVINIDVKNLLITYTSPDSYTDGVLYENITSWKNLPGFGGLSPGGKENLIVSIGFLVESLKSYLNTTLGQSKVNLLIPFPAALPIVKRTWESVSNIERGQDRSRFVKHRIDTLDLSSSFDLIVSIAESSEDTTAFAPFGPKTFSAAMCLYSILKNSPVYYPQPTVYNPNYSVGIKGGDTKEAITAYWIKHDGFNLYSL